MDLPVVLELASGARGELGGVDTAAPAPVSRRGRDVGDDVLGQVVEVLVYVAIQDQTVVHKGWRLPSGHQAELAIELTALFVEQVCDRGVFDGLDWDRVEAALEKTRVQGQWSVEEGRRPVVAMPAEVRPRLLGVDRGHE